MKLFHSFPRPRNAQRLTVPSRKFHPNDSDSRRALEIIESILQFGLLCTPERLNIFPDLRTQNKDKLKLLSSGKPEYSHIQSRFCFTLCEGMELFQSKVREVSSAAEIEWRSHADLFGPFSISFDPLVARRIGIIPTNYYSPTDLAGRRFEANADATPGLNIQMMQRLKELRDVSIVLAMIESSLVVEGRELPSNAQLSALNLNLPFEGEVVNRIGNLSKEERLRVFQLFDIDRDSATSLVSFIEMMLSSYQETDSRFGGDELAFFQQREWRLIHHMRRGMIWYCLGKQPDFRDPVARHRASAINDIRRVLGRADARSEEYYRSCWLLESVNDKLVRDFISDIIVPRVAVDAVTRLVDKFGCAAQVTAAEELGYEQPTMQ